MTPNETFVRNLAGVAIGIAAVTAVAVWLGAPSRAIPSAEARATEPGARPRSGPELGEKLFTSKGCIACHSLDGSARVGPSFKGVWGSQVVLGDGLTLVFDEAYVRESLSKPQAKMRAGFPPSMPSFDGMLTQAEIDALVALFATLRQPASTD